MASISKIKLPNNAVYDVKDAGALREITSSDVTTALGFTPLNATLKGANSGVAELDSNGKVPSSQLPSYVDDVLEYDTLSSFPSSGETGKIYIAKDTNKTYRWSGTAYVEISASLALGITSSTAFRGDYGSQAYTHAVNKGSAFNSGLYKITTNSQGHVTAAEAVSKTDITALGIPAQDTVYSAATTYSAGLMSAADKVKLNGIAVGAQKNSNDITGIKGNAEDSFRNTGYINITVSDIGAISNDTDDTKTANLTILNDDESYIKIKNTFKDANAENSTEIYLKAGIRNHGLHSPGYIDESRIWHDDPEWMIYRNSSGNIILNGNATNDANGNNIATTYLPKRLSSGISDNFDSPSQSIIQLTANSSGTNPSSVTDGNQWLLLTDILDNNKYSGQLAISFSGLAWRGKTNTTTWSDWKRIPLGDGTGASGNWPINAATATKATKDGDGNTISSTYLPLSGGTLTNNLTISKAGEAYVKAINTETNVGILLDCDSRSNNGDHGIWSSGYWNGSSFTASGKWMIYRNSNGDVIVNGNAATATKATGIVDAGNSSKTLTISYYRDGASATDWIPMHDSSGNLVPVSSTNLANKVRDKASGSWNININAANILGTVDVAHGGTGSTTKAGARSGLGIRYTDVKITLGNTEVSTGLSSSTYQVVSLLHINPVDSVCNIKGAQSVNDTWRVFSDTVQTANAWIRVFFVEGE